jgi:hypothetical protein
MGFLGFTGREISGASALPPGTCYFCRCSNDVDAAFMLLE